MAAGNRTRTPAFTARYSGRLSYSHHRCVVFPPSASTVPHGRHRRRDAIPLRSFRVTRFRAEQDPRTGRARRCRALFRGFWKPRTAPASALHVRSMIEMDGDRGVDPRTVGLRTRRASCCASPQSGFVLRPAQTAGGVGTGFASLRRCRPRGRGRRGIVGPRIRCHWWIVKESNLAGRKPPGLQPGSSP